MNEKYKLLKDVLNKFRKGELIKIVGDSAWFKGSLPENISIRTLKCNIIEHLVNGVQESDLSTVIPSTELLYLQTRLTAKTWHMLKINNELDQLKHALTPEIFKRRLKHYLNFSQFKCDAHCEVYNEGIWVCLSFKSVRSRRVKKKQSSTYLVYYPLSPYIIYTDMKVTHHKIIHKALLQIFEGTTIEEISLVGKHVHTLIRLIWQRDGSTFTQPDGNPCFVSCIPREQKITEKVANITEMDEDEQQDKYINGVYGSYKQPPLETLICTTNTKFFGFEEDFDQQIACKVQFKGQSILEGFRQLLEQRYTDSPFPEYIAKIGQLGQNRFHITERS